MNITKDFIENNLIRSDGRINSRKAKGYNIEELYLIYNNISTPTCENNHNLNFISFSKGYKTSCEDKSCTKERGYKNRKQDYDKIHEKVKQTKLEKYGNEHYVNVKQRKETIAKIKDKNISRSKLHPKYNLDNLSKEYIEEHFIDNNKLNKEAFMGFYSCKENWMFVKLRELAVEYKNDRPNKEEEVSKFIPNASINNRTVIKPLELDIYSERYNFAVEYHGLIWHSYGKSKHNMFNKIVEEPNLHRNKTDLSEEKDIQLYQIFENEWVYTEKKHIWISMLRDKQGLNKKIGARKCIIKEVSILDAKKFINENHMQGYVNASIKIGLYYNNILVSIMTFGKSRYNKNIEYELIRFCTKKNLTIQGGGSKMLKYFEKTYKPKSLISYANRRWSKGNFYEAVGFEYVRNTPPNYFYFKTKEQILWSRNKFQKHKLKNILDNYNDDLTETENMYNNDYRKIYDAGNKVYVKNY